MQPELIETGALQRAIEALLFVASEALSIKQIAKLTKASEVEVTQAIARIQADFAGRGIVLRELAGGYRFASAPEAREALSIIAYQERDEGPVTKADIEAIRGVNSDSVIATLLDRRFIEESGRKDVAGRPILYRTTSEFLEAFGLRSLDDLPQIDFNAVQPELGLSTPNENEKRS